MVSNYQYCTETFNQIEDDGDVLLIAQEHSKCVDYYKNKIEESKEKGEQESYKAHGKLANALLENGQYDEAYQNALKSLDLLERNELTGTKKEMMTKVKIAQGSSNIFCYREDYVHYYKSISRAFKLLGDRWFQQAKLLKKKA